MQHCCYNLLRRKLFFNRNIWNLCSYKRFVVKMLMLISDCCPSVIASRMAGGQSFGWCRHNNLSKVGSETWILNSGILFIFLALIASFSLFYVKQDWRYEFTSWINLYLNIQRHTNTTLVECCTAYNIIYQLSLAGFMKVTLVKSNMLMSFVVIGYLSAINYYFHLAQAQGCLLLKMEKFRIPQIVKHTFTSLKRGNRSGRLYQSQTLLYVISLIIRTILRNGLFGNILCYALTEIYWYSCISI